MSPAEAPKPKPAGVEPKTPTSSPKKIERQLASLGVNRMLVLMSLMFLAGLGWMLLQARPYLMPQAEKENTDKLNEATVLSGLTMMSQQAASHQNQPKDASAAFESLRRESRRAQIAIEDLAGNPFIVPRVKETPILTPTPVVTTKPATVEAPPVEHLRLEAVLMGTTPSAMISGQLLSEGQMIDKWRVIEIAPSRVVLQWQDRKYVLKKAP